MRRWIFNTVALVSFILLVGIMIFWARSYFVEDIFVLYPQQPVEWRVSTEHGFVWLDRYEEGQSVPPPGPDYNPWPLEPAFRFMTDDSSHRQGAPPRWEQYDSQAEDEYGSFVEFAGFGRVDYAYGRTTQVGFAAPLWFVAVVLGLLPLWQFWSFTRRQRAFRRAAAGLCHRCGYDLKPSSAAACPECGTTRYSLA